VLVFIPELNKPAAVRLRALLWSLWHDKPLPAPVPSDGMTSVSLTDKPDSNPLFYQSIGYPVFGPRAIRVDMLDRLVCSVYDNAANGQFRAQHKMAEWLGCPIPDLYAVLEAMGHTRVPDAAPVPANETAPPAAEAAPTEEAAASEAAAPATETPAAETPAPEAPAAAEPAATAEAAPAAAVETAPAAVKPELALFRLRRRSAGHAGGKRPPRRGDRKKEGEAGGAPGEEKQRRPRRKPDDKKRDRKSDGDRGERRPDQRGKDKWKREKDREDRIAASAPAKQVVDSPFAVLKNLKVKTGDQ
jgi:ATP-dependent RNA helicase SUPV3L1/SUV3